VGTALSRCQGGLCSSGGSIGVGAAAAVAAYTHTHTHTRLPVEASGLAPVVLCQPLATDAQGSSFGPLG
jgi:hypothetical protein